MTAVPATLRLRREGTLRSRAARGDAAAFAAVYERHHQALYRYCRSILRHEQDAQDALQSTMARAFAALQDEPRDFELRPWLFRIAHNEAISILRRRPGTEELADVPGDAAETEDRASDREELRVLRLDLADLPERQRAALVLRELNGLSHAEIGTVLDLTPTAVKQAIFEARSALFSCREGREMACRDVRRMLSDGDGRVLRGRGVRAHLRSCPDCRRFRADLERRPQALRMLAPPLPTAGAAALLAELLGGSTAKLLACVAIAGGGAGAAVELHDAPKPKPLAAERVESPRPTATPPAKRAAVPPPPTTTTASAPQESAPSAREERAERRPKRQRPRRAPKRPEPRAPVVAVAPAAAPEQDAAPVRAEVPRGREKPAKEKTSKARKRHKREAPARAQPAPTAQAETREPDPPPAEERTRERPERLPKAERRAARPTPTPSAQAPVRHDDDENDEGEDDDDDEDEDDD